MKKCTRCQEEKPDEAFAKRSDCKRITLHSWCRECERVRHRLQRREDPEHVRLRDQISRAEHPETRLKSDRAYRDRQRQNDQRESRCREWAAFCAQLDAVRTPEILDFRDRVTEMRKRGVAEMRLPNSFCFACLDTDLRVLRIREEKASRFGVEWWARFREMEAEFEPIPALPQDANTEAYRARMRRAA